MNDQHAKNNAASWAEEIERMMDALEAAEESGDAQAQDDAEREIMEAPLSVMVRDGWRSIGDPASDTTPEEYEILLTTGGPALRITGDVNDYGAPETARLEWQDWGTPWTEADWISDDQKADLLNFARRFVFAY